MDASMPGPSLSHHHHHHSHLHPLALSHSHKRESATCTPSLSQKRKCHSQCKRKDMKKSMKSVRRSMRKMRQPPPNPTFPSLPFPLCPTPSTHQGPVTVLSSIYHTSIHTHRGGLSQRVITHMIGSVIGTEE